VRRPSTSLPIGELTTLLSADCNVRCSYCYQNAKRPGAMEWPALRAAIDLLLASPADPRALSFAGGEPTLQFGLVRRAVDYATERSNDGRPLRFHLVSNGLLLQGHDLAFLADHEFRLDLSFDGVGPAQDARARGTFERLDKLLGALRSDHPTYFARRVTVAVTVARGTIPHLADSFAYFLSKGVEVVSVQPALGQAEWSDQDLEVLDRELSRIVEISLHRRHATRDIPFEAFRPTARGSRRAHARTWGCSAPLGQALTVDVDGQVFPCAPLTPSYQTFAPATDWRVRLLSLGDVRDPALPERLAALPGACRASGLFEPKRVQHAGERRCATCGERAHCVVCPIARVKRTNVDDVDDIPRYLCAYQRILARHRRRFLARATPSRGHALVMQVLGERGAAR